MSRHSNDLIAGHHGKSNVYLPCHSKEIKHLIQDNCVDANTEYVFLGGFI